MPPLIPSRTTTPRVSAAFKDQRRQDGRVRSGPHSPEANTVRRGPDIDLARLFLWPWMACMPKMQEHFSAMAMDGLYACNAGAVAGMGQSGLSIRRQCGSSF
jgi:hypothetical protein